MNDNCERCAKSLYGECYKHMKERLAGRAVGNEDANKFVNTLLNEKHGVKFS